MLKEMVKGEPHINYEERLSPVEQALREFKKENRYGFLDMINDPKIRYKHNFKQLQKKKYNDDDFLKKFEKYQGESSTLQLSISANSNNFTTDVILPL